MRLLFTRPDWLLIGCCELHKVLFFHSDLDQTKMSERVITAKGKKKKTLDVRNGEIKDLNIS